MNSVAGLGEATARSLAEVGNNNQIETNVAPPEDEKRTWTLPKAVPRAVGTEVASLPWVANYKARAAAFLAVSSVTTESVRRIAFTITI